MDIPEEDLRIEVYRDHHHEGGQTVGVTDPSVRITHIPTGISITCGSERSQILNKQHCMRMLEAELEARTKGYTISDDPETIRRNRAEFGIPDAD